MPIKPYYLLIITFLIVPITGCKNTNEVAEQELEFPLSSLQEIMINNKSSLDISNKFLLINFWATWCAPCRREMPSLQALSESLDNKQFLVIGVSIDTDKNLMHEFLLQQKIFFNNFIDPEQKLASEQLDIQSYPETFIVSPEGKIIKRIRGEQAWNSHSRYSFLSALYAANKNNKSNTTITGLNKNKI